MQYKSFVEETLNQASEIALKYFGSVKQVSVKPGDNNQVLTEADVAIGELIVNKIQQTYPDHNIIDEEAGVIDKNSEFTWVVDPIDGTSNFATGTPHYGIMIGLLHNGQPIAGGIILPSFDQLCYAEKGQGAFCNQEKITMTSGLLQNLLVCYGIDGYKDKPEQTQKEMTLLTQIVLEIRNLRSSNSAYDMLTTARGQYGAFLNQTSKIWDNVAPHIIVEEAGGLFTDFWGKPMDYSRALSQPSLNYTMCAAHPEVHKQLQTIIKENV